VSGRTPREVVGGWLGRLAPLRRPTGHVRALLLAIAVVGFVAMFVAALRSFPSDETGDIN
jgi:hypothetical protein